MTKIMRLIGVGLLATLLLLAGALMLRPAEAANVGNYQTYSVEAGTTPYYSERVTTPINVDGYGTALVSVGMAVKSVTTTFVITAQYAIPTSGLCTASGLIWYDGEDTFDYVATTGNSTVNGYFTDTLTMTTSIAATPYRTAFTQLLTLTGNANEGQEFRIKGRCMRLVITPSSGYTHTFTPTIAILAQDAAQ